MAVKPPENSTISVVTGGREQIVSIPYPKPPATVYLAGVFILFWLGGWAVGEVSAARRLLTMPVGGGTAFLVFWLCAWTVGGLFAMLSIRRVFQRSAPEIIKLEVASRLRSGNAALQDAHLQVIPCMVRPVSETDRTQNRSDAAQIAETPRGRYMQPPDSRRWCPASRSRFGRHRCRARMALQASFRSLFAGCPAIVRRVPSSSSAAIDALHCHTY